MILGLGTDIIEVSRVAQKLTKAGFKEKVFSAGEIAFCEKQAHPEQHYAARFAAKEAFLKATGQGLLFTLDLNAIEVTRNNVGQPGITLHGELREHALQAGWKTIHLSLTHLETVANAVVILES